MSDICIDFATSFNIVDVKELSFSFNALIICLVYFPCSFAFLAIRVLFELRIKTRTIYHNEYFKIDQVIEAPFDVIPIELVKFIVSLKNKKKSTIIRICNKEFLIEFFTFNFD